MKIKLIFNRGRHMFDTVFAEEQSRKFFQKQAELFESIIQTDHTIEVNVIGHDFCVNCSDPINITAEQFRADPLFPYIKKIDGTFLPQISSIYICMICFNNHPLTDTGRNKYLTSIVQYLMAHCVGISRLLIDEPRLRIDKVIQDREDRFNGHFYIGQHAAKEYKNIFKTKYDMMPFEYFRNDNFGKNNIGHEHRLVRKNGQIIDFMPGIKNDVIAVPTLFPETLKDSNMAISRIAFGMLEDIGYKVDYSLADPYPIKGLDSFITVTQEFKFFRDPDFDVFNTGINVYADANRLTGEGSDLTFSFNGVQPINVWGVKIGAVITFYNLCFADYPMHLGTEMNSDDLSEEFVTGQGCRKMVLRVNECLPDKIYFYNPREKFMGGVILKERDGVNQII